VEAGRAAAGRIDLDIRRIELGGRRIELQPSTMLHHLVRPEIWRPYWQSLLILPTTCDAPGFYLALLVLMTESSKVKPIVGAGSSPGTN
jgi:hypothetical protein